MAGRRPPRSDPSGVQREGGRRREAGVADDAGPPDAVPRDGQPHTRALRATPPGTARTPLDRRRVLAAAIEFIDEHGLDALTMRRMGAHLGVEGMALYRHVTGREDLLDGVVDLVVDELYGDPEVYLAPKHGWQDYLQRLAHGVRRIALAHPAVFPLIATRPPAAPWVRPPLRSLRWLESFLDALTSHGFSDGAAVAAYRAYTSFLLGHLLLEDRKSTRLNSSHANISYAVFCLKKKKAY